jgi:hypothetical protein
MLYKIGLAFISQLKGPVTTTAAQCYTTKEELQVPQIVSKAICKRGEVVSN